MKKTLPVLFATLVLVSPLAASAPTPKEKKIMHTSAALLKSLETGKSALAEELISQDKYIQHNLMVPDGRDALIGFLPALVQMGTKVNTIRSFKDGDFVVHHTEYFLFGKPQIGFDVFRYEKGKIVEHWDNLQEKAGPNPDGHSMIDGNVEVKDLDKTEANKVLVRTMITEVLIGRQYAELPKYVSADTYIQHNPHVADGMEGLQKAGPFLARFNYEKVVRVLGQGNFVLAMSQIAFDGQDAAVYDLFRVDDGRIVEHWDVLEMTLARSEWKNANGKF